MSILHLVESEQFLLAVNVHEAEDYWTEPDGTIAFKKYRKQRPGSDSFTDVNVNTRDYYRDRFTDNFRQYMKDQMRNSRRYFGRNDYIPVGVWPLVGALGLTALHGAYKLGSRVARPIVSGAKKVAGAVRRGMNKVSGRVARMASDPRVQIGTAGALGAVLGHTFDPTIHANDSAYKHIGNMVKHGALSAAAMGAGILAHRAGQAMWKPNVKDSTKKVAGVARRGVKDGWRYGMKNRNRGIKP